MDSSSWRGQGGGVGGSSGGGAVRMRNSGPAFPAFDFRLHHYDGALENRVRRRSGGGGASGQGGSGGAADTPDATPPGDGDAGQGGGAGLQRRRGAWWRRGHGERGIRAARWIIRTPRWRWMAPATAVTRTPAPPTRLPPVRQTRRGASRAAWRPARQTASGPGHHLQRTPNVHWDQPKQRGAPQAVDLAQFPGVGGHPYLDRAPRHLRAGSSDACFYQAAASPCSTGVCSGPAGQATCGLDSSRTVGATQRLSGATLETCGATASGATAFAALDLREQVRRASATRSAACADPHWAEWRMP